jgi:hypothetical protein
MRFDPRAHLSWLAFRYLAGELAPIDEAAFEESLACDQAAREALAEAVELLEAVWLAGLDARPIAPIPRRSRATRALGWLAVAAAACLAVIVGLPDQRPNAARPKVPVPHDDGSNGAVALTWSGLRHDMDQDWQADLLGWLDDPATPAGDNDNDAPEPSGAEASTERGLPSWMMEVASLDPAIPPADGETKEN